ncbi:hypothetical protein ACWE42_06405 [Sutcliffiella cohnii]
MLKKYKEQDFKKLKEISLDRLFPTSISVGLMGLLIFSGAMNGFLLYGVLYSPYVNNPIWDTILPISIVIFIVQTIITIFFFNNKRAFSYQYFQSIFATFVILKVSTEGYYMFFVIYEDKFAPTYVAQIGIATFLGGFIFLIISIIRAIKRVKDGHFREGGKGILNFSESKSYVSLPIIFGITMIGGAISRLLSSSDYAVSTLIELYFALFLAAVIQYALVLVWPEFLLLAYCKSKFKSFEIEQPEL